MQPKLILKEIANTLHNSKDRYAAHEKIKKYFEELCCDMNFIRGALKDCIINPKFLNNADNLFFYLLVEGDIMIAINLFPPIYDKEKNITHDNIHHHGWRLLTTGVISGNGYETINFVKKSHEKFENNEIKLKIKEMYRHTLGESKFIDSEQAHVVFHPETTTATLALWSANKQLKNQKIKKMLKNFPIIRKFITSSVHKLHLNQILGLNKIKGVYFHPNNGKIVEMKNYSKPTDGPVEEVLPCMFKFFQQIKFNDSSFFLKIKEFLNPKYQNLCDKLIAGETIPDLGIKGNIRRRFSKDQILQAINK